MAERNIMKIAENAYWIGVRDWNRRIFDALIPLPKGTSYNAYLVIGSNGKALIDTVNLGFEKDLEYKIRSLAKPEEIDGALEINGPPTDENMKRVVEIGKTLARKIFEGGA